MSKRTLAIGDKLYDYMLSVSDREPDILRDLREETLTTDAPMMQISPDQGQFMALLAELIGAKRYLEVGTFTGYSALAVALSMPPDAALVCCDISEDYTAMARRYWTRAGVADRIDLRLAPAVETLDALIDDGQSGTFDMMFIDADKTNYTNYYERGLKLVRAGGLILVDNVLWNGSVADPANTTDDTEAIRAINVLLGEDERVSVAMIGVGDGLYMARKR